MKYIDMHCDTLMAAVHRETDDITYFPECSVDISRLHEAGAGAQFFAMFIPQRGDTPDEHWNKMLRMREVFFGTLEKSPEMLGFADCAEDIRKNTLQGKVSGLLTVENGYLVDGDFSKLEALKKLGVSLISLTWNNPNCFGFCNSFDPTEMEKGLTSFGKEAVPYMNDLGIIVDVSHLSDGGFWDVVNITKKPFVASHSNARALSPHPRNLTDEMIKALADKGGVTGLNFCSSFLDEDIQSKNSTVDAMVRHIEYIINKGGEDCVGIGTDFDGIGGTLEIKEPTEMNILFDKLEKRGWSGRMLEKIAYGNVLRVIEDTIG